MNPMPQSMDKPNRELLTDYYNALAAMETAVNNEELEAAQRQIENIAPELRTHLKAMPQEQREIILAGDTIEHCIADLGSQIDMAQDGEYKAPVDETDNMLGEIRGLNEIAAQLQKNVRNQAKR